jgi:hypothetical protein
MTDNNMEDTMRKMLVYLPVLLILLTVQVLGQVSQTAVPFLLIAPGARPGGMGETFVAIADDATATHWNPAGLGKYPLSPNWLVLDSRQGQEIQQIALVENNMPEINYKQYDVWAIIDGQLAMWDNGSWQTHDEYTLEEGQSIKSVLRRYTGLEDDKLDPYYNRLVQHNNKFTLAEIDSLYFRVRKSVPSDYSYIAEIDNGFEQLKTAWGDLKIDNEGFAIFGTMIENSLADGQMTKSELDSVAFGFDQAMMKRSIDKINIPTGRIFAIRSQEKQMEIVRFAGRLALAGSNSFIKV